MDVVNPCFTPAAQYGRVAVQPVANLIYLRCSSFLHHRSFEELDVHWLHCVQYGVLLQQGCRAELG